MVSIQTVGALAAGIAAIYLGTRLLPGAAAGLGRLGSRLESGLSSFGANLNSFVASGRSAPLPGGVTYEQWQQGGGPSSADSQFCRDNPGLGSCPPADSQAMDPECLDCGGNGQQSEPNNNGGCPAGYISSNNPNCPCYLGTPGSCIGGAPGPGQNTDPFAPQPYNQGGGSYPAPQSTPQQQQSLQDVQNAVNQQSQPGLQTPNTGGGPIRNDMYNQRFYELTQGLQSPNLPQNIPSNNPLSPAVNRFMPAEVNRAAPAGETAVQRAERLGTWAGTGVRLVEGRYGPRFVRV